MKNILQLMALVCVMSLNGCAVIHFENGPVTPNPETRELMSWEFWSFGLLGDDQRANLDEADSLRYRRWYHHAIFQVAELSNPLETTKVCRGLEWNQITTEVTPFDAFVGLLDNALLFNASSAALDLWSPWSIEYSCRP